MARIILSVKPKTEQIMKLMTPGEKKFDDKETPSRCYKAAHVYDLIKNLMANKYGFLDKINYFIIGLSIVCLFFIILRVVDKW